MDRQETERQKLTRNSLKPVGEMEPMESNRTQYIKKQEVTKQRTRTTNKSQIRQKQTRYMAESE